MKIAGHEIDTSFAEDYMTNAWARGEPVDPETVRDMLRHELEAAPACDREWIAADAQRRLCRMHRTLGACRYDRSKGVWVAA